MKTTQSALVTLATVILLLGAFYSAAADPEQPGRASDYDRLRDVAQELATAKHLDQQVPPHITDELQREVQASASSADGLPDSGGPKTGDVWESEPNDAVATASPLPPEEIGGGAITPPGDVDFWRVDGANSGDLLFLMVDATDTLGDSTLTAIANDGTTQIEMDDDGGPLLSSAIAGAVVPQSGAVFLEVHEYGDDGKLVPYHLYSAVIDPTAVETEQEPNDTLNNHLSMHEKVMQGELPPGDIDIFCLEIIDEPIAVIVDEDPDDDGQITDTLLTILTTGPGVPCDYGNDLPFENANTVVTDCGFFYYVKLENGGRGTDTDYRFTVLVGATPIPVDLMAFSIE